MTTGPQGHWQALDGVRALAVLSVMIYHFFQPHVFTGGYLGVDVFFVLSGFLITWGLVGEWTETAGISFRRFYSRRALRLFPALAAVMVFGAVLAGTILGGPLRHQTLIGLPWIALYVGNWAEAFQVSTLGVLGHLWSLGVEEQFYILWPAVISILLHKGFRKERIAAGVAIVALLEAVYREILFRHHVPVVRLAYGLDTHSDALLAGCAVALWLSAGRIQLVDQFRLRAAAWISVGIIAVLVFTGNGDSSFQWGYPLTAAAGAIVIASLVTSPAPALAALLGSRPAVWIGRRSYGLYVWSYPVYYGLPWPKSFTGWPRDGAELTASFVVAAISYRVIELPFLRRKHRFAALGSSRTRRAVS